MPGRDTELEEGLLDANVFTFMGADLVNPYKENLEDYDANLAVFGFPFDSTQISRSGANQGPKAIREGSAQTISYHYEYDTDFDDHYKMVDCGDVPTVPGNAAESLERAQEFHSTLLDAETLPVMLGGDCSTSIAGLRSLAEQYENPGYVHIDSHADTAEDHAGEKYNHATTVARAVDEAGIDPENISLVGMNGTLQPPDWLDYVQTHDINLFPLDEVVDRGPEVVGEDAAAAANEGTDAVYLHVDVDVLDGAHTPGTGVPTAGGMASRELLQVIGVVASYGIDSIAVCETSPQWDSTGVTGRMAVRMIVDALAANATGEANGVGTGTQALRHGKRQSDQ